MSLERLSTDFALQRISLEECTLCIHLLSGPSNASPGTPDALLLPIASISGLHRRSAERDAIAYWNAQLDTQSELRAI